MKYGFYVFNNLKAHYGLYIFDDELEAEESYQHLYDLWYNEEYTKDFRDEDWEVEYYFSCYNAIGYEDIDEIDTDIEILENFKYDNTIDDIKLITTMIANIPS